MKDGWKVVKIEGVTACDVLVENGRVSRGTDTDHTQTLYPYKSTGHGWELVRSVKYETLRAGMRRGAYDMK